MSQFPSGVQAGAVYAYTWDFSNASLPGGLLAGNEFTVQTQIEQGFAFDVCEWCAEFVLQSAFNGFPAGHPLTRQAVTGAVPGANQTVPSLANLFIQIETNSAAMFLTPVRLSLFAGSGIQPRVPLVRPIFSAGETIKVRIRNDGPTPVWGQVVAHGRRLPRGAQ